MKLGMFVIFAALFALPAFAQQDSSRAQYHDGTITLWINDDGSAEIDETCGTVMIPEWTANGTTTGSEKSGLMSLTSTKEVQIRTKEVPGTSRIVVRIHGEQQMQFVPGAADPHVNCLIR